MEEKRIMPQGTKRPEFIDIIDDFKREVEEQMELALGIKSRLNLILYKDSDPVEDKIVADPNCAINELKILVHSFRNIKAILGECRSRIDEMI